MATKPKRGVAALVAALLTAVGMLGLTKDAPKQSAPEGLHSNYSVTPPSSRGFGSPCDGQDFRYVTIYGRELVFNEGAMLPLKAALELAKIRSDYRPDKYVGVYACRMVRGSTSTYSHHAWATAVDFDPADNCLGCAVEGTELFDHPEFVRSFTRFGFTWGGLWSRPDAMHFEYDGPYVPMRDDIRLGDTGAKVAALRDLLRKAGLPRNSSGPYRGKDVLSVLAFQKKNGILMLDPKGVVGPATWTLLVQVTS